jgi:small subunit ribosomal protein S17
MAKTRVVRIAFMARHLKYGRIDKRSTKFKAHDEDNISKIGDMVKIQEVRPISKNKFFRVVSVVKKAALPNIEIKEEQV